MTKKNNRIFDDNATNNTIVINQNAVPNLKEGRKTAEIITNMSRFYSNKAVNGCDLDRILVNRMVALN